MPTRDAALILVRIFVSIENVPVEEDEASESRTALSEQKGSIAFTTTHWSVVLEAQGQSRAAQEALEKLCRTYWRPVYGFIKRQGIRPQEAEENAAAIK